jgi:hypothetical protein
MGNHPPNPPNPPKKKKRKKKKKKWQSSRDHHPCWQLQH